MGLSTTFRRWLLKGFGYYLHQAKTMPVGTDYEVDLIEKIGLKPNVIFDIGANVGQTADFYRNIFPDSSIYCFEPIPETFKKLNTHCANIDNVKCFNIAFGEKRETLNIHAYEGESSVLNSLTDEFQSEFDSESVARKSVRIEVDTLDHFVHEHNIAEIDLLKIDTEGFEVFVLKGGAELIASGKIHAIICEAGFMRSNKRNTYFGDINDLLEQHGYALFGIYEMGHLGFKNGKHYGNLLYISKDYRENTYKNWQVGY